MASPTLVELHLPWPPSLNAYYRSVAGLVLISARGRAYRAAVAGAVLAARARPMPPGRLCVELDFHPPDRRARDLDNLQKALLDACQHAGLYADDALIDRLVLTRRGVTPGGLAVLTLSLWNPEGG